MLRRNIILIRKFSLVYQSFFLILCMMHPAGATEQLLAFSGTLLESAAECTISGEGSVLVEFGEDVYINKINGVDYKKTKIPFKVDCSDVSSVKMLVHIDAAGNGMGCGKLLCTDHKGLGLKLYQDNKALDVGEKVTFVVSENHVALLLPNFYVVPTRLNDDDVLEAGEFTSIASVVLEAP
ncbi:hypothetical protein KYI92_13150 [Pantoea allii]|uniref:Fimbrial-type adhesion domain-containing protein n=1 Tax=Pantoea allii TaxID=574096 RepID=A0ABS6VFI2_9GAMM|nr:fimbrial protein [Pantoea allii]MBW1214089.1 hypothetical protein [Pantoea allii]MBW1258072.1 hypothetical protein [Pantoea allii]MBW1267084.1 hypothetical protein [Pantoea allii]MBW1289319.1 hypothetical protein [Pantoea allii]